MSKLSEAIRRTVRRESAHIGFGPATARAAERTMLLAVTIREPAADSVGKAAAAGADIAILALEKSQPKIEADTEAAPTGLWLREVDRAAVVAARETGVDYMVFGDENSPAEILNEEKIGFVLSLAEGLDDTTLRAIASLPLDAVLVSYWDGALTVRRALELRRLSGFTGKPLILSVDPAIAAGELEALRDSGVVAVLVDGERAQAAELGRLRDAILSLPPRRKRRDDRGDTVSLPAPSSSPHDHGDDDDDD